MNNKFNNLCTMSFSVEKYWIEIALLIAHTLWHYILIDWIAMTAVIFVIERCAVHWDPDS